MAAALLWGVRTLAMTDVQLYFSADCEEHDAEIASSYLKQKPRTAPACSSRRMASSPRCMVLIASATVGPGDDAAGICLWQVRGVGEVQFEKPLADDEVYTELAHDQPQGDAPE